LGLLIRGEVTAGQPLDLEAELAQPFLREGDLPMFKGILVAAADNERKLIPIDSEQPAKVEPVALRFVIDHKQAWPTPTSKKNLVPEAPLYLFLFGRRLRDLVCTDDNIVW
jgi:hypothetical protein